MIRLRNLLNTIYYNLFVMLLTPFYINFLYNYMLRNERFYKNKKKMEKERPLIEFMIFALSDMINQKIEKKLR